MPCPADRAWQKRNAAAADAVQQEGLGLVPSRMSADRIIEPFADQQAFLRPDAAPDRELHRCKQARESGLYAKWLWSEARGVVRLVEPLGRGDKAFRRGNPVLARYRARAQKQQPGPARGCRGGRQSFADRSLRSDETAAGEVRDFFGRVLRTAVGD